MSAAMPPCSDAPIWNVWMAAFHAPTLAVADELGLFAALRDQPATADQLAAELALEPRAVIAMTGVLVGLDFLVLADGRYGLTEVARAYLLADSPYYWGGMLRRMRDHPLDCHKMIDSLRRGPTAAAARLTGMWEAPAPPAAALVAFTEAMHAHSFALAMRILPGFPAAAAHHMLDVAGGSGSYAIAALLHHPHLRATVLELPPVCDVTRGYAERHGVADRLATVAADMFRDPWPRGHDRVLLSDVLHDWDDERCRALVAHAHTSLPPGGRIWLHEMLLDDTAAGPSTAATYSMIMVLITEGRQRTARELTELLTGAGFTDVTITATSGGFSLVEATRA